MSAESGERLGVLEHLRQSIRDILSTPIGTRVMRRDYGSALFALVDAPLDRVTVLDLIQATAGALARWEPRVKVQRVTVVGMDAGRVTLDLELLYRPTGEALSLTGVVV
jgi:phage baseplate assembly protein W